jgi:hypothetical protein
MEKNASGEGNKRQTDSITSQLRDSEGGQAAATRSTAFVDKYKYMPAGLLTVAVRCASLRSLVHARRALVLLHRDHTVASHRIASHRIQRGLVLMGPTLFYLHRMHVSRVCHGWLGRRETVAATTPASSKQQAATSTSPQQPHLASLSCLVSFTHSFFLSLSLSLSFFLSFSLSLPSPPSSSPESRPSSRR